MKRVIVYLLCLGLLGCEEIINEEDITAYSIELLAPTNNVSMEAGTINFNWQTLSGASSYQLQVAKPTFSNATQIVLDTIISHTSFNQILVPNVYEWRVKALNSAYETGYTTNAFEVIETP